MTNRNAADINNISLAVNAEVNLTHFATEVPVEFHLPTGRTYAAMDC
jgi:hypothetical protein